MTIEIKVPGLPESVADATIAVWHKKPGDAVARDENIVDLETDKVVLEIPAPRDGILQSIAQEEGATVTTDDVLGILEEGAAPAEAAVPAAEAAPVASAAEAAPAATASAAVTPAVRRMAAENGIAADQVAGTGKGGRVTRGDVNAHLQSGGMTADMVGERTEKRVPMSRLRKRVAERLLEAQHNAAILTTFNEINLQAVMDIRARYKEKFQEAHGIRLGFMSFFTKAVVEALKRFPAVNASIDGDDVVYHGYYDIGIAVSTERGLVVPVLRNVESMAMADVEKGITDFAQRARKNQIGMDDMTGGTFTITNGGSFGSLLATPIINPPQTGILGMHNIVQRPVAENGQVVIRPMMYVALSYDHRLIDGKESVQFLVTVKELLEDPTKLLLDI